MNSATARREPEFPEGPQLVPPPEFGGGIEDGRNKGWWARWKKFIAAVAAIALAIVLGYNLLVAPRHRVAKLPASTTVPATAPTVGDHAGTQALTPVTFTDKQYLIVRGDTLSGIAHEQCGAASKADDLQAANAELILDKDYIFAGDTIVIPAGCLSNKASMLANASHPASANASAAATVATSGAEDIPQPIAPVRVTTSKSSATARPSPRHGNSIVDSAIEHRSDYFLPGTNGVVPNSTTVGIDPALKASSPYPMYENPNPGEPATTTQQSQPDSANPSQVTPAQNAGPPTANAPPAEPQSSPPISFSVRPLPPAAARYAAAVAVRHPVDVRDFCRSVGVEDVARCGDLTVRQLVSDPGIQSWLRYTFAMRDVMEYSPLARQDRNASPVR